MSNDPFTLDMFGSSALSSGLGLGVTAFGGFESVAANDDDPDPTPPAPARALPVAETPARRAANDDLHSADFSIVKQNAARRRRTGVVQNSELTVIGPSYCPLPRSLIDRFFSKQFRRDQLHGVRF